MATRPIFIPLTEGDRLVKEQTLEFHWHPGFAAVQKMKNIVGLHQAATAKGIQRILEVSTKSDRKLGVRLSAFNLKVELETGALIPLECAFQGSKVFENGGPYVDLYYVDPRAAKRDPRLKESGKVTSFQLESIKFPAEPKTAFYDWIYIRALASHEDFLKKWLTKYDAFSDIEFNPERSINCQARSCALLVSLLRKGVLREVARDSVRFMETIKVDSFRQPYSRDRIQGELL